MDFEHPAARFRYALQPLLAREGWARDALAAELRRTALLAEQAHARWQGALAQLEAGQVRLRALHERDRLIALDTVRLLQAFIGEARATAGQRDAEWQRADALHRRVHGELEAQQLALRTLERHRERRLDAHGVEQSRASHRAADDAWLLRRGGRR